MDKPESNYRKCEKKYTKLSNKRIGNTNYQRILNAQHFIIHIKLEPVYEVFELLIYCRNSYYLKYGL